MFPEGVQPTNEVSFTNKNGRQWSMRFELVDDKFYKFPLENCPGKAVRDTMEKMIRNLQLVCKMVLETEMPSMTLPHPELFQNSRLVLTPITSCFLYNETHGRVLHDDYPKRLAFVWSSENVYRPENSSSHPDDFLGPQGAKNMPDDEFTELAKAIGCQTCGSQSCDCAELCPP